MRYVRLLLVAAIGLLAVPVLVVIQHTWSGDLTSSQYFLRDRLAYQYAGERLVETGTPYAPQLLAGPIANGNIEIGYFYPPPVAQLMAAFDPELSWRSLMIWTIGQWLVVSIAFAALAIRTLPRSHAPVALALCALSYPLHFALYGGNVSGWIAAGIAVMALDRRLAAVLAAPLTMLKLTPAPLLLGALVDARRSVAVVAGLALLLLSVLAAPQAWVDYLRALPNILASSLVTDNPGNTSPAAVAAALGVTALGQLVGIVITLAATLIAAIRAGSSSSVIGWLAPAVVAYVFASPTMWDHYQVALLPIAIAAWSALSPGRRTIVLAGLLWHLVLWFDIATLLPLRLAGLAVLLASCWVLVSPSIRDLDAVRQLQSGVLSRGRGAAAREGVA